MCEKHKVIEHGQKCMKILVNLHKENPDWQNKNGKKKKKKRDCTVTDKVSAAITSEEEEKTYAIIGAETLED